MAKFKTTIEEIDDRLEAAKTDGTDEVDIALLWAARAHVQDVNFESGHLVHLMGITPARADEIETILIARGDLESA